MTQIFPQLPPFSRRFAVGLLSVLVFCAFWFSWNSLQANPITVDFPLPSLPSDKPAAWFTAAPAEWEQPGGRRLDFPLAGLAPQERLVVTLIFEDAPGLSIRAWWESDALGPIRSLAGELAEGLPGWNQRHFLLTAEEAASPGLLVVESVGSARAIHRVVFSRLEPGAIFVPPSRADEERFSVGQKMLTEEDLSERPWIMPPDSWSGRRIEAYLQEQVESLSGGVEFAVEIRPAPRWAVLRFEVRWPGFEPPLVWANGHALSGVSVEIPSLRSSGYIESQPGGDLVYAGWRSAWVAVPHGALVEGENRFLISTGQAEGFIRHARLEMWFLAPLLPMAVPEDARTQLPDVVGESLGELPTNDAPGEPLLPEWSTAEASAEKSGSAFPSAPPQPAATPPASGTPPALNELFRTSFSN